ncbi:MAG TPA: cobalamin biosynthesis protein CbiX [Rariglobus sp.]|nr:cobalamin biosynthesis protein CbiX [Rariglobus sp.]
MFDNGSLRAESTLSLRRAALELERELGRPVQPVSLLHSSGVASDLLDGQKARLLETALGDYFTGRPDGEAVLVPLFFGPSAALTDYVPGRIKALKVRFPRACVRLAPPLVDVRDGGDLRVAMILADQVRIRIQTCNWNRPAVVLVDHGSPQPVVTAVRDHLAMQMHAILGGEITGLTAASMERRPDELYDFNEPLLATALSRPPLNTGNVIVALQFLSPGRHAGPDGDVAQICAAARDATPGLVTAMTEPIAGDPRLAIILAERAGQAVPL